MDQRPKHMIWNLKLLEENIGQKFHNIGGGNNFLDMTSKAHVTIKSQMEVCEKFKNLRVKRHCQEIKKATHRTGENTCKSYIW